MKLGTSGLIVGVVSKRRLPDCDGVWCYKFACGHERIIGDADDRKQNIGCAECERVLSPFAHRFTVKL